MEKLTMAGRKKTGDISVTVEDRAKVRPIINGLYKMAHGLSNSAKMYDLK